MSSAYLNSASFYILSGLFHSSTIEMNRSFQLVVATACLVFLAGCQADVPIETPPGPPSSDIWLFDLSGAEVNLRARITDREGYDNQPAFTEDGNQVIFSSDRTGQINTFSFDVDSGDIRQITFTDADKYSPTPIPGTGGIQISVVHSDSIVTQGLWRYSLDGKTEPSPITDVDNVAYFTWIGTDRVLFWRLSTPTSLQLLDTKSSTSAVIVEGSVFSLKRIPSQDASAYLASLSDNHAEIRHFDWETGQSMVLTPALENGRDFAVTPDGRLLMMSGSDLHSFEPGTSQDWDLVTNLGIGNSSRIAVSPDGLLLAVVGTH